MQAASEAGGIFTLVFTTLIFTVHRTKTNSKPNKKNFTGNILTTNPTDMRSSTTIKFAKNFQHEHALLCFALNEVMKL